MIQVGQAGPQGIIQHRGKKKCMATRKAKAVKTSGGRQATLLSLGFSKAQNHPSLKTATQNEAPVALLVSHLPQTLASVITTAVGPIQTALLPHPDVVEMLTWLCGAVKHLPRNTELPTSDLNELAQFVVHPSHLVGLNVPSDDVWEVANPILNRAIGFGQLHIELKALIQQNWVGTIGICNFIEYLLVEKCVSPGLLEGKVE